MAMVFRAMVFTFIPTAIELVLVCGFLATTFTPLVSGLVVATFLAYVGFTASMTGRAAAVCPHPSTRLIQTLDILHALPSSNST